ncbi:MAG: filamentous hemagglutinin N-terminal domain-containing protein [Desulfobulbaceae bacterium]|jgi:filamentous hemagglutinin family protein|nr:filamentous hemagglutinin N-terminal domain-containing protein [Desulfobulbaceae bacterium]
MRSVKKLHKLLALSPCLALLLPSTVFAAPSGGKVVGGQAQISQSGPTTTINQATNRAIINWQAFDIGQNEAVIDNMPSTNSAGLHRVIGGGGASQLAGSLQSNGNVFLVNPAGVIIHNGARVETGGFVASTADISNKNFMAGNYLFNKPGQAEAAIINSGLISVRDSGFAALVAPSVRNDGIIAAKLGKVALASGASFTLDVYGDDLISFTTSEQMVDTLHTTDGVLLGVDNKGTIKAEGGAVLLTAKQLDGVVSSVVNNSGLVSAAAAELAGGKVVFKGEGAAVDVVNTGVVDASSASKDGGSVRMTGDGQVISSGTITATGGQHGGGIVVTGNEVTLTGKTSVDASGQVGGGTVLLGGNAHGQGPEKNADNTTVSANAVIKADAITAGDGGQVVVWSQGKTAFDGAISAKGGQNGGDGGWVETSGQTLKVGDTARVDTSAPVGKFGTWLLDPTDFVVGPSGGIVNIDTGETIATDMTGATLSNNLENGSVVIRSGDGSSGVNGDISVYDNVTWASNTVLTLMAYRDVNVNAKITATGDVAGLNIAPATGGSGAFNLPSWATITLSGANPSLSIFGQPYTVINNLLALQAMNQNLAGYYALGKDIDASDTSNWDGGAGFVPIGTVPNGTGAPFTGVFHGLGHTITGLTINSPYSFQGLFGYIDHNAQIDNIGIINAVIAGYSAVGGLVGMNAGTITDSYSTGTVNGNGGIGGLVGENSGIITNSYSTSTVTGTVNSGGISAGQIGGLVGYNNATITNSYSTGTVTGDYAVGGLVGYNMSYTSSVTGSLITGTITNSYSTGIVTGTGGGGDPGAVGGLVGMNAGTITNSYSIGAVAGTGDAFGGLVGTNYGTISTSYSTGAVTGYYRSYMIGGFVGYNDTTASIDQSYSLGTVATGDFNTETGGFVGENSGTISRSYSTGAVTTGDYSDTTGGFVGGNAGTISNSYSTGAVTTGTPPGGGSETGGFVGASSGEIFDSYSTGKVSVGIGDGGFVDSTVGGFVGENSNKWGTISNSYWDSQTSGLTTSAGGTGLTTAQMMQQASFNNWDFVNIWSINEGQGYPTLRNVGLAGGNTGMTGSTTIIPPGTDTTNPGSDTGNTDSSNTNTGSDTGNTGTNTNTGGGLVNGGGNTSPGNNTGGNSSSGTGNAVVQEYLDILDNKNASNAERQNLVDTLAENPEDVRTINQYLIDEQDNAYASLGLIAADDSPYAQRVNNILAELSALTGLQLSGKVYMDNTVNAFSAGLGDGNIGEIRVFYGELAIMTDDELFFALAHEVGHIVANDNFAVETMNIFYNPSWLSKAWANNFSLKNKQQKDIEKYSLAMESAADAYAVTLMLEKTNINPMAAVTCIGKFDNLHNLAAENPGYSSPSPNPNIPSELTSTPYGEYGGQHPSDETRISDLKAIIASFYNGQ